MTHFIVNKIKEEVSNNKNNTLKVADVWHWIENCSEQEQVSFDYLSR
jgi:hypothetical protein